MMMMSTTTLRGAAMLAIVSFVGLATTQAAPSTTTLQKRMPPHHPHPPSPLPIPGFHRLHFHRPHALRFVHRVVGRVKDALYRPRWRKRAVEAVQAKSTLVRRSTIEPVATKHGIAFYSVPDDTKPPPPTKRALSLVAGGPLLGGNGRRRANRSLGAALVTGAMGGSQIPRIHIQFGGRPRTTQHITNNIHTPAAMHGGGGGAHEAME